MRGIFPPPNLLVGMMNEFHLQPLWVSLADVHRQLCKNLMAAAAKRAWDRGFDEPPFHPRESPLQVHFTLS